MYVSIQCQCHFLSLANCHLHIKQLKFIHAIHASCNDLGPEKVVKSNQPYIRCRGLNLLKFNIINFKSKYTVILR